MPLAILICEHIFIRLVDGFVCPWCSFFLLLLKHSLPFDFIGAFITLVDIDSIFAIVLSVPTCPEPSTWNIVRMSSMSVSIR